MSRAANRAAAAARAALNQAMRDDVDSRRFRVEKFGRHRDGYLHARIIVDGTRRAYFHLRYGSWLAPGSMNGREFLKEPEALLGTDLGRVVKFTLSDHAQRFHPTIREEEPDAGEDAAEEAANTRSDGTPVPDAGVPA